MSMRQCVVLTSSTKIKWNLLEHCLRHNIYFVFLDEIELVNEERIYKSTKFEIKERILKNDFASLKKIKRFSFCLHSLMQIDFERTSNFYFIVSSVEFEFFKELLGKLGINDRKIEFWDICVMQDSALEIALANLFDNKSANVSFKTPKKYCFKTNAKMIIDQDYESALYIEDKEVLKTHFKCPKHLRNTKNHNKNKFLKKFNKLRRSPKQFFKDAILKRIR